MHPLAAIRAELAADAPPRTVYELPTSAGRFLVNRRSLGTFDSPEVAERIAAERDAAEQHRAATEGRPAYRRYEVAA